MNLPEARKVVEIAVYEKEKRHLNDAELRVLEGSWDGQTYDEMAEDSKYEANYLKGDVGHKFWKLLSEALGEQVSKRNFRAALERARARFSIGNSTRSQSGEVRQPQELACDLYVERPPIESDCYEEIMQPGALIRIKAPSLMGKTQLMNKILEKAEAQGYRTVNLSFELAERMVIEDLDKFLRWFCACVGEQLGLTNQIDAYWNVNVGSKVSCKAYFEQYLLKNIDKALVLGLENLDRVFKHSETAEDFLSLLRAWYEEARRSKTWKKLRLVLLHSREVNIPWDKNQSPFNVGLPIELPEFNFVQVREFAQKHGLNWDTAEVEKLMDMVGGHPYLVEVALNHICHDDITLEQLLQTAPKEAGLYSAHLRQHRWHLQQNPDLLRELEKIVDNKIPVPLEEYNPEQVFELHSMGLVKLDGKNVTLRCELYRQYFQECLRIKK